MSESDNIPETESFENAPRRPPFRQNRPPSRTTYYAPRGRGRTGTDPHVQKALKIFGVPDLRDLLDRKHQDEQLRGEGDFPNDPTCNFLRDPSRGDSDQRQIYKDDRGHQPSGPRGRGRFKRPSEHSFIQNPLNIKVEIETATGERHYSLNHDSALPDIKHIPDHDEHYNELGRGRGRSDKSVSGFERERGSSYRGRSSSFRGRGRFDIGRGRYETIRGRDESDLDTNESEWDRSEIYGGRQADRGRYESGRGERETEMHVSVPGRGRKYSDRGRSEYRRGGGRDGPDLDTNESEWGRNTSFRGRGRIDVGRDRHETIRGRNESDLDTNESEWDRNETYGGRRAGRGRYERESDGYRSDPGRGRKDSDRGRNEYRRGRGRDPRGRGGIRAKSSERFRSMQSEEENGDNSKRGARIRSRSAETRDNSETKNIDAENKGRGRGGRGRGRGGRRGGRYKQERASTMKHQTNAPAEEAETPKESILEDGDVACQTELESTDDVGVEEQFDWVPEGHIEQYADEEVEEEIQDDHGVEKRDEVVEIKENLIITSIDPKQKKRIVRFDLTVDDNVNKSTNFETTLNPREDPKLIEDGIEKLNLKSN